ncbi:hypothetical protein ONZ45_g18160 [Pleurotus djamor]|nr:hypothetical protein ONZ45_g18160 [Pleurotus djamor]
MHPSPASCTQPSSLPLSAAKLLLIITPQWSISCQPKSRTNITLPGPARISHITFEGTPSLGRCHVGLEYRDIVGTTRSCAIAKLVPNKIETVQVSVHLRSRTPYAILNSGTSYVNPTILSLVMSDSSAVFWGWTYSPPVARPSDSKKPGEILVNAVTHIAPSLPDNEADSGVINDVDSIRSNGAVAEEAEDFPDLVPPHIEVMRSLMSSRGWPIDIQFDTIPDRVKALKGQLDDFIRDAVAQSSIWTDLKKSLRKEKMKLDHLNDVGQCPQALTDAAVPGYYGPRGANIIERVLLQMYPSRPSRSPLTFEAFSTFCLVPFVGACLIQEDIVNVEDHTAARQTMLESAEAGRALHPFPDDTHA